MYLSGFLCERASVLSSDLRAQAAALSVCVGSGYGSARLLYRAWEVLSSSAERGAMRT